MNLTLFLGYLVFLTNHCSREVSVADLVVELSTIIVGRFSIVKKLLSIHCTSVSPNVPSPSATLSDLLSMLRTVLDLFLTRERLVLEHVAEEDTVLVVFPVASSEEIPLPRTLLEAILLLLSLLDQRAEYRCREYLMNLFFPTTQPSPHAVSMATKEPLPLASEQIWAHILCSTSSAMAGGVVDHLSPPQLCHMIQLSGVPLQSAELMLEKLDLLSAATPPASFHEGLRNTTLLVECVQSHLVRGSKAGRAFLSFLQQHMGAPLSLPPSLEELMASHHQLPYPQPPPQSARRSSTLSPLSPSPDALEQLVISCLTSSSSSSSSSMSDEATRKLVMFLCQAVSGCHDYSDELRVIVSTLHRLITSPSSSSSVSSSSVTSEAVVAVMSSSRSSPSFLSLLTKAAKQHRNLLQPLRATMATLLTLTSAKRAPHLFSVAVRACSKQLEEEESIAEGGKAAMLSRVKEMKSEKLLGACSELVQRGDVGVEEVLVRVARKAVEEGKEREGLTLLTRLDNSLPPLPHTHSFTTHGNDIHEQMDWSPTASHAPKISVHGLTTDLIEVLDPNILALCPSEVQRFLFSPAGGGGGAGRGVGPQQSYLMGRVTHQSSWVVSRNTIMTLLDPTCHEL